MSHIEQNAPKPYTAEDVVTRSSALYNFVSDKSK
jgi:hypothetical protein